MEEDDNVEWQLVMNGKIKDFETLEKVLDYILKNKDELYYCSVRKIVGAGCSGFVVNRT